MIRLRASIRAIDHTAITNGQLVTMAIVRTSGPQARYGRTCVMPLLALPYVNETGQAEFKTDAVVECQCMLNATGLVLDRVHEKGWSYQHCAHTKAIERNRQRQPQPTSRLRRISRPRYPESGSAARGLPGPRGMIDALREGLPTTKPR